MDQIPCEIIRDLIPLVADHAASKESEKLVQEHIAECGSCRALLQYEPQPEAVPVVARTLKKLRRRLFWTVCAVLVIGIGLLIGFLLHFAFKKERNSP